MKNLLILTTIATLFVACSNNNTTQTPTTTDSTSVEVESIDSLYSEIIEADTEILTDSAQ
jgi:uncharacterized protein YaaN involved in tellurite resistance